MHYTISDEKLAEVTRMFNEQVDPEPTEEVVKVHLCYDWPESQEHQDWMDYADPQEMVDWLAATFYIY